MPISPRPRLARRRTGGAAHRVARGASVTLDCREMAQNFRFEGMTLTVENVERSLGFYAAPAFAMLRLGAGTIGLLSVTEARKEGVADSTAAQKQAIHVEFSTDDLDVLYEELKAKGVVFHQPPHDEPWERAMTAFDPDGYAVEFAQGKRGENAPR
jgi:uncharacterized glyoxalase superfamily protein PhnB